MKTILFNLRIYKKPVLLFVIVLISHSFAFSQTRFYLNLNTVADISPAFNAGWNVTTGANRYEMSTTKDGSALTDKTTGSSGAAAVRKCLLDQWVSQPLATQTITGTFTGQIRFDQSSTSSTIGQGFVYVRIINANGTIATEVGTSTTTDLTTAMTNRTLISLNVGTLNITAGQRIAIDLGWNYSVGTNTGRTCTMSRGSSHATDLPANNTTTNANTPWFEFSQNILFYTPPNNECTGAILLTSAVNCVNTAGSFLYATATAGLPACGNATSPDLWYSFVAQSAYPSITLSSVGANLTTATPRIQLFSGTCGSLTQLTGACVATPLNTRTNPGGAGLTVGTTYYVRITTTGLSAPVSSGTYTFNICITDPNPTGSAVIDYGKTYVNITDGTVGGTINPGDVLEIRATLVVQRNAASQHRAIDSISYFDTLHAGKGFAYQAGTLALRTNEGKLYKSFTDSEADSDAGWVITPGAGTDTTIQMNMGFNATKALGGVLRSNSRPSFYGNTCIIMATFRVAINKGYDTKINFGGGAFRYRDSVTGVFYKIEFPRDSLIVYQSPGSCPDAVSPTNVVGDEFNGTFGAPASSAGSQNRAASANTNYIYALFSAGAPQDYYYGVANNTSATNAIVQTVPKSHASRVHSVWDITGDHTSAVNTGDISNGNKPCNPGLPISTTNPCGYMLAINSAYKTDVAFEYNFTGSCPETYYEISAWFKNICYKCGCDSTGTGSGSASGYIPTAPGDSSGVRPNIAMQIDGIDFFTTGELLYVGLGGTQTGSDTLNKWVRRSFVFKTGPTQNSFKVTFRNNAPGGGGNDWALDDISIRTCYPGMIYSPSVNPMICANNGYTIYDTVRSYYNTYVHYKWQRSINGGATWTDLAGGSGVASPIWNGSSYEYVISYFIPPGATTPANNGDLYRVVVASTAANLASGTCYSTEVQSIQITIIPDCTILESDFVNIAGTLENSYARIRWQTSKETEPVKFELQRSTDGIRFEKIAIINGKKQPNAETNLYSYLDSTAVKQKVYYRIMMFNDAGKNKYSNIIQLAPANNVITLFNVVNPFNNELHFEMSSSGKGEITVGFIDQLGRTLIKRKYPVYPGVNSITVNNTEKLAAGIYFLRVESIDGTFTHKVIKSNN